MQAVTFTGQRETENRALHPGPVYKYIFDYYKRCWRIAIGAFVVEMAKRIAVDTGMTGGSLYSLAGAVRERAAVEAIVRGKGPLIRKKGHSKPWGGFTEDIGPFKSMTFGHKLGEDGYEITYGNPGRPKLEFKWRYTVRQHLINSERKWYSLAAAGKAFDDAFYQALADLAPQKVLMDFLLTGKLPIIVETTSESDNG